MASAVPPSLALKAATARLRCAALDPAACAADIARAHHDGLAVLAAVSANVLSNASEMDAVQAAVVGLCDAADAAWAAWAARTREPATACVAAGVPCVVGACGVAAMLAAPQTSQELSTATTPSMTSAVEAAARLARVAAGCLEAPHAAAALGAALRPVAAPCPSPASPLCETAAAHVHAWLLRVCVRLLLAAATAAAGCSPALAVQCAAAVCRAAQRDRTCGVPRVGQVLGAWMACAAAANTARREGTECGGVILCTARGHGIELGVGKRAGEAGATVAVPLDTVAQGIL